MCFLMRLEDSKQLTEAPRRQQVYSSLCIKSLSETLRTVLKLHARAGQLGQYLAML